MSAKANCRQDALAASRASLALGRKLLAKGDSQGAIARAEEGLAELGDDYADPSAIDDTDLKLDAARDLIELGRIEDGASLMLRMLKARTAMYADKHRDQIAET